MTVRIINRLASDECGIPFESLREAMFAFYLMLLDYERQGYTITVAGEEVRSSTQHSVVDKSRRPVGIYSVVIDSQ